MLHISPPGFARSLFVPSVRRHSVMTVIISLVLCQNSPSPIAIHGFSGSENGIDYTDSSRLRWRKWGNASDARDHLWLIKFLDAEVMPHPPFYTSKNHEVCDRRHLVLTNSATNHTFQHITIERPAGTVPYTPSLCPAFCLLVRTCPPLPTASTLRWPLWLMASPSTSPFSPKCPFGHYEVGLPTGHSPVPGAVRATLDPWVHFEDRYSILLRYRSAENQDRLLHTRSLSSQSKACSDLSEKRYPSSPLTSIFSGTQRLVKPSGLRHGLTHNVPSHILRLASGMISHPSDDFAVSRPRSPRFPDLLPASSRLQIYWTDRLPTLALRVRPSARAELLCRIS